MPIVGAAIRADALSGFRGEPFAGQKEHSITSVEKGEWNMPGIEAGLWLFSTTAPDMLPSVIVLPVKFSQRQQVSAIGNSLTWQLPLSASPLSEHPMLKVAAELLAAGKKEEATQAYKKLINEYFYGQCWDPQGWFWKPAEAAQQKLGELDNV